MTEVTRRRLLGAVAGGAATVSISTLPHALAWADLAASIDVTRAALDDTGYVGELGVVISNERPPDGDPIHPVPSVWGQHRETQIAWNTAEYGDDYPAIAPGQAEPLTLLAPGYRGDVRLKPEKKAMIRVFDGGQEQHTSVVFTPAEHFTGRLQR